MPSTPPITLQPGATQILAAIANKQFDSDLAYQLHLQAERLLLLSGFDQLISLEMLDFSPFPYQIKAAQAALRRFRGRGMLCDEVGLGKTIEAGLVLKEYIVRRMADRVLILTPPGLVQQWREELAQKFKLPQFVTNSDPEFRQQGLAAWEDNPFVIASLAAARLKKNRAVISKQTYDLVIIDEAHHLKNRSSVSWKFVNKLQKKFILLLTATPVENRLDELYNLITILKPGQLKTPKEFRAQFVVKGDPRLPKNRGQLRELLADVMVRHSRGQVSVTLPPRRAHTVRLTLSRAERELYDAVTAFVRRVYHGGGQQQLVLRTLQREIGSSPYAAARTLSLLGGKKVWQPYRQELAGLAEQAATLTSWTKADALLELIEKAGSDKLLIFTHFRETLHKLAYYLGQADIDVVTYHGGLSLQEKEAAIRKFEQDGQILLSSEAAGEGRNLQFCHVMVNFDLPWNPQRIEQRVGRIHRVGQKERVEIFNLSAENTIEDHLLHILDRKLNMFELVIGEMDMILGHMTKDSDFEALLLEVWLKEQDPQVLSAEMDLLGDKMLAARRSLEKTQAYDDALFGEDFAAE
ncbi:MAG TPA: DEAD/DEAH box helicase [Anaerolineae bacterium]|nr:DEAD/DEAH box helicase [Anaerolineae bacterium]